MKRQQVQCEDSNKSVFLTNNTKSGKKHKVVLFAGGGLFGYLTIYLLSKLDFDWAQHVDTLGGTSIGGILSMICAVNPDNKYIAKKFKEGGPLIFKKGILDCLKLTGPKYNNKNLRKFVELFLSDYKFKDISKVNDGKLNYITLGVDFNKSLPIEFHNINLDEQSDMANLLLTDISMVTSAAPTYLSPVEIFLNKTVVAIDGGVVENIPIITTEKILKSELGLDPADIDMFVIGTGSNPAHKGLTLKDINGWTLIHWLFNFLIPYVTLSNEMMSVHWGSKSGYNSFTYYNPVSTTGEMDDVQALDQIEQLVTDQVIEDFTEKFKQFLEIQ